MNFAGGNLRSVQKLLAVAAGRRQKLQDVT